VRVLGGGRCRPPRGEAVGLGPSSARGCQGAIKAFPGAAVLRLSGAQPRPPAASAAPVLGLLGLALPWYWGYWVALSPVVQGTGPRSPLHWGGTAGPWRSPVRGELGPGLPCAPRAHVSGGGAWLPKPRPLRTFLPPVACLQ